MLSILHSPLIHIHTDICIHSHTYMHICICILKLLCISLGHVTFQKRTGKRNIPADCHITSARLVYWQWLWVSCMETIGVIVTPATIFAPIIVTRSTVAAFVSNTVSSHGHGSLSHIATARSTDINSALE